MPVLASPAAPPGFRGRPGDYVGRTLDQDLVLVLGRTLLGIVDDWGVRVSVGEIKGWWGAPETTAEVSQRPADDGGWASAAYRAARHIELTVDFYGLDFDHLTPSIATVVAAIPKAGGMLQVTKGSDATQATVLQDGSVDLDRAQDRATLTIPLVAPDPRRYSLDESTASTGLPTTSGGLSLPVSAPFSITATVTSGTLTVTNAGNESTRPTFTVTGPCPPFSITQPSTGKRLVSPVGVDAGRVLTIDTDARTALLDGTAPRVMTGTWFDLPPGDSQIAFAATSYDPAAQLSVSFRSAWR